MITITSRSTCVLNGLERHKTFTVIVRDTVAFIMNPDNTRDPETVKLGSQFNAFRW